jgi:glycerol-3-phosphate dehydrogenase
MAFSVHQRPDLLQRLQTEVFDLIVVGGGITGAGIARDASLRGLKVALIERGDFACGTSSRSSKLIHGGLRYLEMGDIALVFEAVRERQRLIQLAPHLARPQSFLLPVYEKAKRGVFMLDIGLTLYDLLASFSGVLRHRALRKKAMQRMEPLLRGKGLSGGVRYFDAMTDDGRLVMANLRGAVQAGAVVVPRVSFEAPVFKNGQLTSVRVRDEWDGQTLTVATRCVVSATGPWTDELMGLWQGEPVPSMLRPSKGSHIVLPRERLPLAHAVMMSADDGRIVFALPWPDATVIGTTDTAYEGDFTDPRATVEDAEYLLKTANAHFEAVGGSLTLNDVISAWAGIRPLVAAEADQASYRISREHVISSDPRGMVAVAGGKLTTYRVMAAETVDAACKLMPPARAADLKPALTHRLPLPGADRMTSRARPLETLTQSLVATHHLLEPFARHLAYQYGSDADEVVAACLATDKGLEPVVPGQPVAWGELRWIVQEELPMTLVDLTVRRTPLYYLSGDRMAPAIDELARRMGEWCSYSPERTAQLSDEMRNFMAHHRLERPVAQVSTEGPNA